MTKAAENTKEPTDCQKAPVEKKPADAAQSALTRQLMKREFANMYADFINKLDATFQLPEYQRFRAQQFFDDGYLWVKEAIEMTPIFAEDVPKAEPVKSSLPDEPSPLVPDDSVPESKL